jgi:hypothetical protein
MHVRAVGTRKCCADVGVVKHAEQFLRVIIGLYQITPSHTSPFVSCRHRFSRGHPHTATSLGVDISNGWQIFRELASGKWRRLNAL